MLHFCYDTCNDEDIILISDLDEIPNLEVNNLKDSKNKFVFFNQLMIYYKLNLYLQDFPWVGSKACKKKYLKSPQWLRNIKDRIYPWWRLDILFSEKKFSDIKLYQNGGWHFSYLKDAKGVEDKLKSIRHHVDYELNPVSTEKLDNMIKDKKYTHFLPKISTLDARKKWIIGSLNYNGTIYIDNGAAKALSNGKSLLAAGITKINGNFKKGENVIILDQNNNQLARGLSSFSSVEIDKIKGKQSREIEKILGYLSKTEVIHKDDMVLL